MTLKEMIFHRKSCRCYTWEPVDEATLEKIRAADLRPLYPEIGVKTEIVRRDQVRSFLSWLPPQMIAIYSEKTEGYLENIHVYCSRKGGRLDIGIALAHLYIANERTFRFIKAENMPDLPGYRYIGSVSL